MDHSLPPETRLVESELCAIFGLGRTRLRQVLQRLAHERVVTLMRNRGATVAKPSIAEARDVFAARRVIESNLVETFIKSATRKDMKQLHEHLAREEDAWRNHDVFGSNERILHSSPSGGLLLLLRPSIRENMPLHVSLCKETFLLHEFMQADLVANSADQRTRRIDPRL